MRTTLVPLLVSLAGVELALQVASGINLTVRRHLAPPWEVDAPVIDDPRLIYRGNPLNPSHDQTGYRNPQRPTKTDIVVLGDSHSYGPSDPNLAWPRLLSRETSRSVYNMALPVYGPGHSFLQLDEALSLNPRLVIVAPYFGNDFFESYQLALRHPALADAVIPALREAAAALERQKPLKKDVHFLFDLGSTPPSTPSAARRLLGEHVKLYGLLRALKYRVTADRTPPPLLSREFRHAANALSPDQRRFAMPFDGGDWRTILTAPYRGRVLDDRDPRIRLGFEVARYAVRKISERCSAAGVDLLVVFVPTKESVFWPRVGTPDRYPGLHQIVADEERLRQEWVADLRSTGVAHLDLLDALRAAPSQPYYEDVDGHPNEVGHRIIAALVALRVRDGPAANGAPRSSQAPPSSGTTPVGR